VSTGVLDEPSTFGKFAEGEPDETAEISAVAGEPEVDPEAPYGRNPKTGKPYRKSPEARAEWARQMNEARWAGSGPAAPRKTTGRKTTGKTSGTVDYRPGIMGLLSIPIFGLGMLGRYKPECALDAATLSLHGPVIAGALNETAQHQQWLADILEKALTVGPYGAVLGALVPVALQIAANHGKLEPNAEMGILSPEDLIRAVQAAQGRK
jgi:hypothetical protein